MRVSDLTRPKPVQATVDLGDGDAVALVFDRNKVTPAWATLAMERESGDASAMSPPMAIADVLISWDVTNDDGTEFPPTAANVAVLSYPAQRALLKTIMEAAVPSDAEGNSSSVPPSTQSSVSEVPAGTFQNGQVTSPSLVPSASQSQT